MKQLVVDVGLTRLKWGLWDHGAWQAFGIGTDEVPQADEVILGCHRHHPRRHSIMEILSTVGAVREIHSHHHAGNVINGYQKPDELGVDRFAALVAARALYPNTSLMIADAGSALTLDALTSAGHFTGGLILPGLESLRTGLTQRLPHLQHLLSDHTLSLATSLAPADNSAQALTRGVLFELVSAVAVFHQQLPAPSLLLLTGGDAALLALHLQSLAPRLHPHLVLDGLRLLG